jgi:hypothetical protein
LKAFAIITEIGLLGYIDALVRPVHIVLENRRRVVRDRETSPARPPADVWTLRVVVPQQTLYLRDRTPLERKVADLPWICKRRGFARRKYNGGLPVWYGDGVPPWLEVKK